MTKERFFVRPGSFHEDVNRACQSSCLYVESVQHVIQNIDTLTLCDENSFIASTAPAKKQAAKSVGKRYKKTFILLPTFTVNSFSEKVSVVCLI